MKLIRNFASIIVVGIIVVILSILNPLPGYAAPLTEGDPPTPNPTYFSSEIIRLEDGTELELNVINGPPEPPGEYRLERTSSSLYDLSLQSGTLTLNVPAYIWSFGCSPTSGSMIAAYYDRNGFPDLYTGPTNGGVMPMDNSVWSFWISGCSKVRYQNPLSASRDGLDGRTTEGHVDDYWTCLSSTADDPYIGPPGWPEHDPDSIADFMYSSRSDLGVPDGATFFHSWANGDPLLCSTIEGWGTNDGAVGLKEFYEYRGYSVSDCYTQKTDNRYPGGFSFEDFKGARGWNRSRYH